MKKRYTRLEEIAEKHEEPLDKLIPRVVSEEGSYFKAALRLNVYPNALRNWAKRNGYIFQAHRVVTLTKVAVNE